MITGSCLCRAVQFHVTGDLPPIVMCHCQQCRKAQGTAFVTNLPVKESQFQFTKGEDKLLSFESSPGKRRYFCSGCGSPIMSKSTQQPGQVRLRAGTLDGDLDTRPGFHIFTDSKANWYNISDDLPQHRAGPPKT